MAAISFAMSPVASGLAGGGQYNRHQVADSRSSIRSFVFRSELLCLADESKEAVARLRITLP